jgi:hypothetical protein
MRFGSLGFIYTGPAESVVGRTFARPAHPNVLTGAAGRAAFVRGFLDETIMAMLGPNPTQERYRLTAYYLTDLAFKVSGAKPLAWGEFMERYTAMYPRGQPGLLDDLVTTYVDALRASRTTPGSATAQRAHRVLACECFVCVASASSSSNDAKPAPHHRATATQHRARLDKLAEARR